MTPMKTTRIAFGLGLSLCLSWLTAQAGEAHGQDLTSDYASALRRGDLQKLQEMLDGGASANAQDAAGNTALMQATAYGDVAAMRVLIERGADVNAANAAGATPLMRAAIDPEKVALLLDHGAKVNGRSVLGNTPLILAARPWNSHRAVEMLLARGADAKATNNFGATALMAAAAGGDATTVQLLLAHGADVNAQPSLDQDKLGFILGGGRSALSWAAYRGDLVILKLLLDAGAEVNAPGMLGTALAQAAWGDQTEAARLLIERGAKVDLAGPMDGYTPLHWAASSEEGRPALVNLLLSHGADPNQGGGEHVDAFLGTLQTPLMLARRRGESPILAALVKAGATNASPERVLAVAPPANSLPEHLEEVTMRAAIERAIRPLQHTSIASKQAFVRHASHQDCISCHSQSLPMAAVGWAKKHRVAIDQEAEKELIQMVAAGELKTDEVDWEPLFHPDPASTKGYMLFGLAAAGFSPTKATDAWVHHLAAIQGRDGQWYNNLPRPPIQTGDIGATALAVHALQRFCPPGRKDQYARQVELARRWLWSVKPENTDSRIYQLLGLAWAGEPATQLQSLAKALLAEQRADGGWAQLPGKSSDAYATGQALYALRVAAALQRTDRNIEHGLRYLLANQLADGTWYVHRRAFPFQPTMDSGFPHGRDSWISSAASSWAVMALSLPDHNEIAALQP
jgi:ankyrin repeat protein